MEGFFSLLHSKDVFSLLLGMDVSASLLETEDIFTFYLFSLD